MPAPTIVFDLDGTLVDTAPDLIDTLNFILARHDVAPVAFDEARAMIGAGVKPLLQRALASKGCSFRPTRSTGCSPSISSIYAAHIADHSRPFPGLERGARCARRAEGCRLAVCTNKLEWLSVLLLDEARPRAALRGDLRAGHVRDAQAGPRHAAPDHRAGGRRYRRMP